MATVNKDFLDFNGLSIYDGKLNSERFSIRPTTFTGTHAEWENLSTAEKAKYEYVNFTDDYNGSDIPASQVTYSNTSSGLAATNVQGAVDELSSEKIDKTGDTMTGTLNIQATSTTQINACRNHTSTSSTASDVNIGNAIPNGTAGSSYGRINLFGSGSKYTQIRTIASADNRTIDFPDASGILALTSDIKPVVTRSLSTDSNVSGVADGSHRAVMHVNLSAQKPTGYRLHKVEVTMAWANGNSYDSYLEEVLGTNLQVGNFSDNDLQDLEFIVYRKSTLTPNTSYSFYNAYWIYAEWLPSYLFS